MSSYHRTSASKGKILNVTQISQSGINKSNNNQLNEFFDHFSNLGTKKGVIENVRKEPSEFKTSKNVSYKIESVKKVEETKPNPYENKFNRNWTTPGNFEFSASENNKLPIKSYNEYGLTQQPSTQTYNENKFSSSQVGNTEPLESSRSSFGKKPTASETYLASDKKESMHPVKNNSNDIVSQLNNHINEANVPKYLLDYLRIGDMQNFLTEFEKLDPQSYKKIRELKVYFKDQEEFYKNIKLHITNGFDSSAFYENLNFNFFEEVPKYFNRILEEISKILKKFDSFKEGSKSYLSSNTNEKILSNFEKFMKAISLIASEREQLNQEIKKLQGKIKTQEDEARNLKVNIDEMKIQMLHSQSGKEDGMKRKYFQCVDENETLKTLIRQLSNENEENTTLNENLRSNVANLTLEIETLKFNSSELINKIKKSDKTIQSLEDQMEILNKEKSQATSVPIKPLISQAELENLRTQLENIRTQLETKEKEVFNLKKTNHEMGSKENEYIKIIRQFEDKLKKSSFKEEETSAKNYLESSSLLSYSETTEKFRLVNMIKEYVKSMPIQFKLLYKFEKFVQPNFHSYVDNKSNFLLIIRLVNNNVIGGFCPYPMAKHGSPNAGFLFNLSSNSLYPLKEGRICFTYDEYYLTLGNAELRIRIGDSHVYSSFGTQNEHFYSKNHKIGHFFYGYDSGNIKREMDFEGFEIYEVKFNP